MTRIDLADLDAGFSDLALGSQSVFRSALQALSHPGRPVDCAQDANVPSPGSSMSAALLLALMDAESRLWLSPSLAGGKTGHWLRFHTGCSLVEEPAEAQFAWAADISELPPLDRFSQGSLRYPDQSATCLIDVLSLVEPVARLPSLADPACTEHDFVLRGPGILKHSLLRIGGLSQQQSERLASEMAANHTRFPCGVDVFLATAHRIVGLPRTTSFELEA